MRTLSSITRKEVLELLELCGIKEDKCKGELKDNGKKSMFRGFDAEFIPASSEEFYNRDRIVIPYWEKCSVEYDEWDMYSNTIYIGEVIGVMGHNYNTLAVVKWFIDHGFDVWGEIEKIKKAGDKNE